MHDVPLLYRKRRIFDDDDGYFDDGDAPVAPPVRKDAGAGAGDEDEEDPLDAFMRQNDVNVAAEPHKPSTKGLRADLDQPDHVES